MTDQQMRDDLLRELRRRVADCTNAANEEEYFASVTSDPSTANEYRDDASRCRRRAQHFEQAIALVEAAPMPSKDEPR